MSVNLDRLNLDLITLFWWTVSKGYSRQALTGMADLGMGMRKIVLSTLKYKR